MKKLREESKSCCILFRLPDEHVSWLRAQAAKAGVRPDELAHYRKLH
jgi:hypothetical protein